MPTIAEVYESYNGRNDVPASNKLHDCWVAIKQHVEARCVWEAGCFTDKEPYSVYAWDTTCSHRYYESDMGDSWNFCPGCGRKIRKVGE